jgi:hypothetical protein
LSSSTHNQALSALLFLYKEVLGTELPWMVDLQRPSHSRRIPTVLTREDTSANCPRRQNGIRQRSMS